MSSHCLVNASWVSCLLLFDHEYSFSLRGLLLIAAREGGFSAIHQLAQTTGDTGPFAEDPQPSLLFLPSPLHLLCFRTLPSQSLHIPLQDAPLGDDKHLSVVLHMIRSFEGRPMSLMFTWYVLSPTKGAGERRKKYQRHSVLLFQVHNFIDFS